MMKNDIIEIDESEEEETARMKGFLKCITSLSFEARWTKSLQKLQTNKVNYVSIQQQKNLIKDKLNEGVCGPQKALAYAPPPPKTRSAVTAVAPRFRSFLIRIRASVRFQTLHLLILKYHQLNWLITNALYLLRSTYFMKSILCGYSIYVLFNICFYNHLLSCTCVINWIKSQIHLVAVIKGFNHSWLLYNKKI